MLQTPGPLPNLYERSDVDDCKRCTKCGEAKLVAVFGRNSKARDGLFVWCKPCKAAYDQERRRANLDLFLARERSYHQRNREQSRAYNRERWAADPEGRRAYHRAWTQQNPERARAKSARWRTKAKAAGWKAARTEARQEYERRWRADNPSLQAELRRRSMAKKPEHYRLLAVAKTAKRRAWIADAGIVEFTAQQLEARLSMFGGCCWVCGAPANQVDHVKPLAKGGLHVLANFRPICGPCNRRKSDQWPLVEFLGGSREDQV